MFLLAYLLSHSLGYLYDEESNREQFLYKLKAHDIFLKVSESSDSLNWYGKRVSFFLSIVMFHLSHNT